MMHDSKEIPEHRDILGKIIMVNDFVAFPQSNGLLVGKVTKINAKMIRILRLSSKWRNGFVNKYPQDCVKLDQSEMTFFILKHSA